jgi:two-component system OmpR family sensor kinase
MKPLRVRRRLSRRMPLRVQLVLIMSGLVTVALVLTGIAASAALKRYLVGRVDSQLKTASAQIAEQAAHDGPNSDDFRPHPAGDPDDSGGAPCEAKSSTESTSDNENRPLLPSQYYVQISDAKGIPSGEASNPLAQCAQSPAIPHLSSAQVTARGGNPFTVPAQSGGGDWRVVALLLPGGNQTISVATPLSDVDSTLHTLSLFDLAIGACALLLLAGLAHLAVRRSLRPLIDVEETAEAIAAGDLTRRVPDSGSRTEVGRLSHALNGMLTQIESAFRARETSEQEARTSEARMRRFITDAGHELRTPLTSIRGFAELYRLGGAKERADIDQMMRRIEAESGRMGLLVDDLLVLARLDQHRPLERDLVDAVTIARDAVGDARAVAPHRDVRTEIAGDPVPALVIGDEPRLRQIVGNLVGNALMHTPDTAWIAVRVKVEPDADVPCVVLEVADNGPGIAPEDASRVFERFYRVESSRSRTNGGSGLGLSIVAALTEAHGGTVDVETALGRGATFRVRLPLAVTTNADDDEVPAGVSELGNPTGPAG